MGKVTKYLSLVLALALICALFASCGASGAANAPKNGAGTSAVSVPKDAEQDKTDAAARDTADGAAACGSGSGNSSDAGSSGSAASEPNAASGTPAAASGAKNDPSVISIGEKMFVGQMNDIYANTADYIGKTISYEGFFTSYADDRTGAVYNCIVRNGPGCCGYDAVVGFEFDWNGAMPKDDDWCRITGEVGVYQENGFDYIRLNARNVEVLPVRGNDTVTQ